MRKKKKTIRQIEDKLKDLQIKRKDLDRLDIEPQAWATALLVTICWKNALEWVLGKVDET